MESLHKLETMAADWFKNVPHLPKGGQKWLADNIWWLAIIAVVLSVMALLAIVPLAMLSFGLSATMSPYAYGPAYSVGAFAWLTVLISLVSLVAYAVLAGMAISPLKAHKKKGWDLLFLTVVIDAVVVAATILTFDFSSLLGGILGLAISGYLLFEIRSFFLEGKVKTEDSKKVEKTEPTKTK